MNSRKVRVKRDDRGSVKLWVSVGVAAIIIGAALVYFLMPEKVQYLKDAAEQHHAASSSAPSLDPYAALHDKGTLPAATGAAPPTASTADEASTAPLNGEVAATDVADTAAQTAGGTTVAAQQSRNQPRTTATLPDRGLALIMDDVGYGHEAVTSALALGVPLTFSILPDAPDAVDAANKAHNAGHVVMLHMPMEPKDPDTADQMMGKTGLTADMNEAQMRQMMEKTLRRIPHVSGVSNHMGSMLTEQADAMRWLMKINREHGLFFLDSLTTPNSVGRVQAAKAGIAWASRRFFLDNDTSEAAMNDAWQSILKRARQKGGCIVIFHASGKSLAFLKQHLHEADGLFIPLTSLLHQAK